MLYLIARRERGHATAYAASVDGKNVANFRTKEENSGKWLLHFLHSCIHTMSSLSHLHPYGIGSHSKKGPNSTVILNL